MSLLILYLLDYINARCFSSSVLYRPTFNSWWEFFIKNIYFYFFRINLWHRSSFINVFDLTYLVLWKPLVEQGWDIMLPFILLILLIFNLFFLLKQLQSKCKSWSFINFRIHFNSSIKLLKYFLWNIQSQTDSMNIHLIRIWNVTKHSEQLFLIFSLYSCSSIYNGNFKICLLIFFKHWSFYCYTSLFCEFESIRLQIKNDLLNSLFVMNDTCW